MKSEKLRKLSGQNSLLACCSLNNTLDLARLMVFSRYSIDSYPLVTAAIHMASNILLSFALGSYGGAHGHSQAYIFISYITQTTQSKKAQGGLQGRVKKPKVGCNSDWAWFQLVGAGDARW